MPRRPTCSLCGEVQNRKMATSYWAWTWPTGDRRSYKQRTCVGCSSFMSNVVAMYNRNEELCMKCDQRFKTHDSPVQVYLTAYIPNRDRIDAVAEYHAGCFEQIADYFTQGAERLPDRVQGGGPPSLNPMADPWAGIGVNHVERN